MSKEFQLAYIRIGFFHLRKEKKNQLPDLIKDKSVKLTVTTGLEALGRGSDLNKLTTFAQIMQQFAPMAQLGMKLDVVANRVANSLNLDITGVMATQEELAAAQQAQSNNSMMEKVMPNLVNKASDMAMQNQQQEFEQQQV